MADKEVSAKVVESETLEPQTTVCAATEVINTYMYGSVAAGFIPVPLLDMAVISGIQLKMVHSLTKIYGLKFSKDICKSILASLIGGAGAVSLGNSGLKSIIKSIPLVGSLAGAVFMPATAAALTFAVGKVFVQHFESGGTFLNFNPEKVKEYFAEQFESGKLKVK